jgi:hypothetical protein
VPSNDSVFNVAENESMLSHDTALKQSKRTLKAESEKETGQSILMLANHFHEKVMCIKGHL